MPDSIRLKALGKVVTLLRPRDILEHIDLYMGKDACDYIQNSIERGEEEERETEFRLRSDLGYYEASLESNACAFGEIKSYVQHIQVEIEKPRTNKAGVKKLLAAIETEISNQF